MTDLQETLVLVKPDGVARGLTGEILRRIEAKGYSLVDLRLVAGRPRPARAALRGARRQAVLRAPRRVHGERPDRRDPRRGQRRDRGLPLAGRHDRPDRPPPPARSAATSAATGASPCSRTSCTAATAPRAPRASSPSGSERPEPLTKEGRCRSPSDRHRPSFVVTTGRAVRGSAWPSTRAVARARVAGRLAAGDLGHELRERRGVGRRALVLLAVDQDGRGVADTAVEVGVRQRVVQRPLGRGRDPVVNVAVGDAGGDGRVVGTGALHQRHQLVVRQAGRVLGRLLREQGGVDVERRVGLVVRDAGEGVGRPGRVLRPAAALSRNPRGWISRSATPWVTQVSSCSAFVVSNWPQ